MSYAAENHSTKLLHSFHDAVVRHKLKSNLAWFYFPIAMGVSTYIWNVWLISDALYKKCWIYKTHCIQTLESG